MGRINIFAEEWCNMVFKKRNKAYGAYELRQLASKRQFLAFLIAAIFFLTAFSLPGFIKDRKPNYGKIDKSTIIDISDVGFNKPKEENANALRDFDAHKSLHRSTLTFIVPQIEDEVPLDNEMISQHDLLTSNAIIASFISKGNTDDISITDIPKADQRKISGDTDTIVKRVERWPDFPGGPAVLAKFLKNNLKYPQVPADNGISGTVSVNFVVSRTGKISNIVIA